jgi:histidyl-tRNA synthetase
MFRYERPQKGRNRQFFQFGMESFGWDNVFDELQQIVMLDQIFRDLEISEFELQLNSIGQLEERIKYKDALIKFLLPYKSELDEDSIKRLDTNPLRIFDSKVAQTIEIMRDAPLLCDYFSDPTKKRFDLLCEQLTKLNVKFNLNSGLVRGLDYYNDTVFEFTSGSLGAQATFCAGGRYDSLVSQMGGEEVPASGFAIGIDRLAMLTNYGEQEPSLDVVFIVLGNIEDSYVLFLQNSLSTYGLTSSIIFSNGKLKSQLSKANKLGAKISMIINDEEFLNNSVIIKPMLIDLEQVRADYVSCIEQTVKILRG